MHSKIRSSQDADLLEQNGSLRSSRGARVMRYITTCQWTLLTWRRWSSRKFPIPAALLYGLRSGCWSRPFHSTFNPWLDLVPSVTVVSPRNGRGNPKLGLYRRCCIVLHRVASLRRAEPIVTHVAHE